MPSFALPDEFDLSDHFDHRTLTRAMALQPEQALLSEQVHGDELQTRVRGSGAQVYEQDIRFHVDSRTGLKLRGICSCPVGLNCKHVAAALMAFEARLLRARRPGVAAAAAGSGPAADANGRAAAGPAAAPAPALPRGLENWLAELPDAARVEPRAADRASPRVLVYVLVADGTRLLLRLLQGTTRRSGEVGSARAHGPTLLDMMCSRPAYLSDVDETLFAALLPFTLNRPNAELELSGPTAAATVRQLLSSGRCWLGANTVEPLPAPPGPPARWVDTPPRLRLEWRSDAAGAWRQRWEVAGTAAVAAPARQEPAAGTVTATATAATTATATTAAATTAAAMTATATKAVATTTATATATADAVAAVAIAQAASVERAPVAAPPDTASALDTVPPDTAPSRDTAPPDTAPALDTVPPDTAPSRDSTPPDTAPSLDTAPLYTAPSLDTAPSDTAPPDTAPRQTAPPHTPAVTDAPAVAASPSPARPVALVLLPAPHLFDAVRGTFGPASFEHGPLPGPVLAWLARMPPVSAEAMPLLVRRLRSAAAAHGVELPLPPSLAAPVQEWGTLPLQPVLRLVTCPNVPAESWLDGHQRPLPAGQPARQAALQLVLRYAPQPASVDRSNQAAGAAAASSAPRPVPADDAAAGGAIDFHFPAGASDVAFIERPDPRQPGATQLSRFRRDAAAEAAAAQRAFGQLDLRPWSRVAGFALERLAALKGARVQAAVLPPGLEDGRLLMLPIARSQWPALLSQHIPALEAAGWQIERDADFPYEVFDADDIELSIDEARGSARGDPDDGRAAGKAGRGDWFKVGLKVSVGGEPVDLVPLLVGLVHAGWLAPGGEALRPGAEVLVPWPHDADDGATTASAGHAAGASLRGRLHEAAAAAAGGRKPPPALPRERLLRLSAERVAPLVAWLRGVFGSSAGAASAAAGARVSRFELGALESLAAAGSAGGITLKAPPRLTELMAQLHTLRTGVGLPAVAVSPNVRARLRPYQLDGLAWMDFLRRAQFGGVLADDMGLGKTLQALALLQAEVDAGRADRPSLVVVPTSLLGNWQAEAARFTPQLRTLVLHGKQRAQQFAGIAAAHLVVTSYPLAVRDAAVLAAQPWHYLILDEAQRIKNSRSQAALALKGLGGRHRLCLSGTPLENHLGELWSLMDFVSPGLLGSEAQFREHFRNPVEKRQDALQAEALARRVRPFILRRTKAQVARDLPEKTETLLRVELDGTQRDLYETVRATMDGKLREAIAKQGLARSQIVVLDALLKLRQVCCDPRLLKSAMVAAGDVEAEPAASPAAAAAAPSAKLELLLDLLPTLVEDGRRILVFSQFTEMLALIERELERLKLGYLKLTGETADRAAVVRAFQDDAAPIFLISLKAGGVGLNLTAADTVILYDPWWNPAVEQQAIDRAYRIGQDKPVFVYKLVASGTVEDKMLELQARKAGLADALLKGVASDAALSAEDFDELFRPLAG